jgi:glucose/arabinose dehydrogenase
VLEVHRKVQRVRNGIIDATVLDLAVNSASERGLLGIALHPGFPANPGVYLYWTESSTGADSAVLAEVPLLGNRVDRFVWNGTSLVRSQSHPAALVSGRCGTAASRNHNGGVIKFGPDGKLWGHRRQRPPRVDAESSLRSHRPPVQSDRDGRPVRRPSA